MIENGSNGPTQRSSPMKQRESVVLIGVRNRQLYSPLFLCSKKNGHRMSVTIVLWHICKITQTVDPIQPYTQYYTELVWLWDYIMSTYTEYIHYTELVWLWDYIMSTYTEYIHYTELVWLRDYTMSTYTQYIHYTELVWLWDYTMSTYIAIRAIIQ